MRSKLHRAGDCLQDIVDNIARIEAYTEGLDQADLGRDGMLYDAVERCLERICEAMFRLGDDAEALLPEQPVRDIRGMGNRLRHGYDGINAAVVWAVVANRLPGLKADAAAALERVDIPDSLDGER